MFVDVEVLVIDARVQIFDVLEHHGTAAVAQQVWRGSRRLDDRAIRSEIAAQYRDARRRLEGLGKGTDHGAIPAGCLGNVFAQRASIGRARVQVEQRRDFAHDGRQSTRVEKIFHEIFARGLQVDQTRQLRTQLIPILERQRHSDAAGDRQQVNDRVGRSADRGIHANGILERRAREDLRKRHLLFHHLDDPPPGELRLAITARVHGGNRRIAG